ncbi:MAG: MBL fold metallo-hydrolase, partial [Streptosporangiaceae bacterium]
MAMVEPAMIVDEGLGNASYLLDLGDGRMAVIDPGRDPRPYLQRARRCGLRVAFAVETHVHADFVTGVRELAARGARVRIVDAGDRRASGSRAIMLWPPTLDVLAELD